MGGIWERQIRSVRNVLSTLLAQSASQLDDESLRTFLYEAANIVNSRPLTTDNLTDPTSPLPLSPNHILTKKSQVVLPPPGEFVREDMYLRRKWKRVQCLLNLFWSRFKTEYLNNLQVRNKWNKTRRNLQVGDIVIVKDEETHRNCWPIAIVVETYPSKDGLVRKVRLRIADSNLNKKGIRIKAQSFLDRPIHKCVLLLENESGDSAADEPS